MPAMNLGAKVTLMALIATVAATLPATASLDVDLGAAIRVGDDTDLFFAISSRYFDRDRRDVESWSRRGHDPDDLAVALFVAGRTGRSPNFIFSLRREGLGWWDIGLRVGLPVDAWFVPVERHPGPPYGNAYGHWKKHGKKPDADFRLSDADLRNLVAVRMIHEYYGVDVSVAMDWRSTGRELPTLLSTEYRRRHGKKATAQVRGKGPSTANQQGKGKANGKAKGHR